MKKKYSLKDLTIETLQIAQTPLSPDEIWAKACELGLHEKLDSYGKTPSASIGAYIYTELKDKSETTQFVQISKRPSKFTLKDFIPNTSISQTAINKEVKEPISYSERDLHILLSTYVYSDSHFKCYTKTIYHEKSSKDTKGKNKWLHPDIVGVYFPFGDYDKTTLRMIESLSENTIKLFSFEMKIEIDLPHLREYFFQAVSNSSWANEGYLVALNYSEDSEFRDEMRRLNNSFGIGFIRLNAEDIAQSEILLPAKENKSLDWETINRLIEENPDFKSFVDSINEDNQLKKVKTKYDDILDSERMHEYVIKHNMIKR